MQGLGLKRNFSKGQGSSASESSGGQDAARTAQCPNPHPTGTYLRVKLTLEHAFLSKLLGDSAVKPEDTGLRFPKGGV